MLMQAPTFASNVPLPLWQTEEWARTLRALGRDAWIETLSGHGQALVISRKIGPFGTLRFSSRGPSWRPEATEEDRASALMDGRFHILNPAELDTSLFERAGFIQLFAPKQVATLRILSGFDAQLSNAKQKWRNAARQGLRKKLLVSHENLSFEKHSWIFQMDRKMQRKKGYRSPHPILTRCFNQVNSGHVLVSQTWQGNEAIAAMIFLRHGSSATYHLGWTSERGRNARAHHVMLLKATLELYKNGVAQIDLGIYDPANSPGLARFKRGTGGTITTLGGTWIRNPFFNARK